MQNMTNNDLPLSGVNKTQRGVSVDAGKSLHYINNRMCPDVDGTVSYPIFLRSGHLGLATAHPEHVHLSDRYSIRQPLDSHKQTTHPDQPGIGLQIYLATKTLHRRCLT